MPLTTLLKRLRFKMASLQSPRTQCCCCAVGVFAAMFGIFMLSAGICILLNVTFMEVDTSGLPPELHNEDGKKVVGIILICVSIASLGLSASVSVVYFVICNKKVEHSPAVRQENTHHGGSHDHGHHRKTYHQQNGSAGSLDISANGKHRHRPGSRDSTKSAESMHSFNGRRVVTSPGGTALAPTASGAILSRGKSSTSRGHPAPGGHSRKHHKKRGLRPNKHRSQLPTHTEEDPESARSVPDLKSQSTFYVDAVEEDEVSATQHEMRNTAPGGMIPPTIVVGNAPSISSTDEMYEETILTEGQDNRAFERSPSDLSTDDQHAPNHKETESVTKVTTLNSSPPDALYFNGDNHSSASSTPPDLPNKEHPESPHHTLNLDSPSTVSTESQVSSLVQHYPEQPPRAQEPSQNHHQSQPTLRLQGEAAEDVSELNSRTKHYTVTNDDVRSESRSSFNSSSTMEGEEQSDTERVRQKMKELIA